MRVRLLGCAGLALLGTPEVRAQTTLPPIAGPRPGEPREFIIGVRGDNLLNEDIRNSVSYTKDQVLMPGASVRAFANVKW
jgi:iron complex outermembrane recepter protein